MSCWARKKSPTDMSVGRYYQPVMERQGCSGVLEMFEGREQGKQKGAPNVVASGTGTHLRDCCKKRCHQPKSRVLIELSLNQEYMCVIMTPSLRLIRQIPLTWSWITRQSLHPTHRSEKILLNGALPSFFYSINVAINLETPDGRPGP